MRGRDTVINQLQIQNRQLQIQNRQLQAINGQHNACARENQTHIGGLKYEIATLTADAHRLNKRNMELANKNQNSSYKRWESAHAVLDKLTGQLIIEKGVSAESQAKLDKYAEQLTEEKRLSAATKAELAATKAELVTSAEQLTEEKRLSAATKAELAATKAEREKLTHQLSSLDRLSNTLRGQLVDEISANNTQRLIHQAEIRELKTKKDEIKKLKTKIEELEDQLYLTQEAHTFTDQENSGHGQLKQLTSSCGSVSQSWPGHSSRRFGSMTHQQLSLTATGMKTAANPGLRQRQCRNDNG